MKPSKTAYKRPAKRAAKKRPAKRGDNPMIDKLLKLKYRINDVYRLIESGEGKPKFDLTMLGDTRVDKQWVMEQIEKVRGGGNLYKMHMEKCNEIWRKYA